MATSSLPAPSLILRQRFARQIAETNQPLSPYIVGPAAFLLRYDEEAEKDSGLLGTYDPDGQMINGQMATAYPWPDRPTGSEVDADYVKVFLENAFLEYHADDTQTAVRTTRNAFRSPNHIYQTNSFGASTIGTQGARPGDRVKVLGIDMANQPFELSTYILDIIGDPVPSIVGAPQAAQTNVGSLTASSNTTPGTNNSGTVNITAGAAFYSGLKDRRPSETYTITVEVGGPVGVAAFSVASASGTDDQASVGITAFNVPIPVGTRGLTVAFNAPAGTDLTVGDSWVISVTQDYAPVIASTAGTYDGTRDRKYIIEVVEGGVIGSDTPKVRVTSADGQDTLPPVDVLLDTSNVSQPINVGSFGTTLVFTAPDGLMLGDKFSVEVQAEQQGAERTLVLAHDFPANVATDTTAALRIRLYIVDDVELERRSSVPGQDQFTVEDTQLIIGAQATATTPQWQNAGVSERLPIRSPSGFGEVSQIYVTYRAFYPGDMGIVAIGPNDDLDSFIPGVIHPDNPLKYAVALCRGSALGETVLAFNVGNPNVSRNWERAATESLEIRSCYGHVPLTTDPDILDIMFNAVQAGNAETRNYYRVLWTGARKVAGGMIVDDSLTTDGAHALASVEDDPSSSGTQYTLMRLAAQNNLNFLDAGVKPGDEVRYNFSVNAWGDETYQTRVVDQVLSATQLTVTTPWPQEETITKRVEIYRRYDGSDLEEQYSNQATQRASDLVRYVLAPEVVIGSFVLPSYFAAAILAGMRASEPAQRSLTRLDVPGISLVVGLELMDSGTLDRLAADGAMILINDRETGTVKVRHGVTTGETEILAKREESMVSARHVALFTYADRLKPYVAQINLSDARMDDLSDLIRAELVSATRGLQSQDSSPALGGVVVDLIITFIGQAAGSRDTLKIIGELELGRPGNYITMDLLIS